MGIIKGLDREGGLFKVLLDKGGLNREGGLIELLWYFINWCKKANATDCDRFILRRSQQRCLSILKTNKLKFLLGITR